MNKKTIVFCLITITLFIAIIKIPVQNLFQLFLSEKTAGDIKTLLIATLIITLGVKVASNHGLLETAGIKNGNKKNYWMFGVPLLFPTSLAYTNLTGNCFDNAGIVLTASGLYIIHALCEEVVFRGLVLGYLLKYHPGQPVRRMILISAILFALAHCLNAIPDSILGIIPQVIYAFYMGLLLGAILVRTRNIWLLGLVHGIINFIFSGCNAILGINTKIEESYTLSEYLMTVGSIALLFSPCLIFYLMLTWDLQKTKPRQAG